MLASNNPFSSVLLTEGTTPTTPAAGKARLFVDSADGLLKWVDDAGTVTTAGAGISLDDLTDVATTGAITDDVLTFNGTSWAPAAPTGGGGATVLLDQAVRTAGDLTTGSTTFTDVDTALDLGPMAAAAGDMLEVGFSALVSSSIASTAVGFDVQTRVAGAGVNYLSTGTGTPLADGVSAWRSQNPTANNLIGIGLPYLYTIQAGDLDGGTITLRLRWRVSATPTIAKLYADGTNRKAQFWAKVYPV